MTAASRHFRSACEENLDKNERLADFNILKQKLLVYLLPISVRDN